MKIEDFKDVEVKIQIYTKRLDMKQLRPVPICSSSQWRQMAEKITVFNAKNQKYIMMIEDKWKLKKV